jgi:hypothetical protein
MKFQDLQFKSLKTKKQDGIQAIHKCSNGYNLSIIQLFYTELDGAKMPVSYGAADGLYEVAVTKNGKICGDVYGYLDEQGVENLIVKIEAL